MFALSNNFGGLLNRPEPHLIGPNRAQSLSNVQLYAGSIKAQQGPGTPVYTGPAGVYRSAYKFNGTWIASNNTTAYQYVEFQGKLIRVAAGGVAPQASTDGITWYNLGITAPTAGPSTADSGIAGNPNGTYSYYVTFVSTLGGESGPSPASSSVTVVSHSINLTAIPVSTDPQVTKRNIYRTGGTVSAISLIATLADNVTTTLTDNVADVNVGAAIQSTTYAPPPNLEWIAVAPYGSLFGGVGANVYYCQPELPQAWPATNMIQFTENTVGGVPFGGSVFVLTISQGYMIIGDTASGLSLRGIPAPYGCLARDTIVNMGQGSSYINASAAGVFYLANEGVCIFNGFGTEIVSKDALADSTIGTPGAVSPVNARAARFGDRYILFVQSGTAFPNGGYLEWNKHIPGNWLMGTVTATATHYNRLDDKLYIAQGDNNMRQWEDPTTGAPLAGSYTTGAWIEQSVDIMKHWRQAAIAHSQSITASATVDGVVASPALTLTQGAVVQRTRFRFPAGVRGREIYLTVSWLAGWTGRIVEILDNVERKATQL